LFCWRCALPRPTGRQGDSMLDSQKMLGKWRLKIWEKIDWLLFDRKYDPGSWGRYSVTVRDCFSTRSGVDPLWVVFLRHGLLQRHFSRFTRAFSGLYFFCTSPWLGLKLRRFWEGCKDGKTVSLRLLSCFCILFESLVSFCRYFLFVRVFLPFSVKHIWAFMSS
jgi:hypothetical protein